MSSLTPANFDDMFDSDGGGGGTDHSRHHKKLPSHFASASTVTLANRRRQQTKPASSTTEHLGPPAVPSRLYETFVGGGGGSTTNTQRQPRAPPDRLKALVDRIGRGTATLSDEGFRNGGGGGGGGGDDDDEEDQKRLPPGQQHRDFDDEEEEGFLGGGSFGDSDYVYTPMNPFEQPATVAAATTAATAAQAPTTTSTMAQIQAGPPPNLQDIVAQQQQLHPNTQSGVIPSAFYAGNGTDAAMASDNLQSVANVQTGLASSKLDPKASGIPTFAAPPPQQQGMPTSAAWYYPYTNPTSASSSNANTAKSHDDNSAINRKLDYIIHLLEEQREQRTSSTWEDVILYGFLGLFLIFICDCAFRYAATGAWASAAGLASSMSLWHQQQQTYSAVPASSTSAPASSSSYTPVPSLPSIPPMPPVPPSRPSSYTAVPMSTVAPAVSSSSSSLKSTPMPPSNTLSPYMPSFEDNQDDTYSMSSTGDYDDSYAYAPSATSGVYSSTESPPLTLSRRSTPAASTTTGYSSIPSVTSSYTNSTASRQQRPR